MRIEVKVPVLPESVTEATLLTWHKKAGDAVTRDENLVDIETDKVVLDVPAPDNGVLVELVKQEGDTVMAQELIAIVDTEATAAEGTAPAQPAAASVAASAAVSTPAAGNVNAALSPAVRHMLEEHKLDPSRISGSGKDGRILKEDVLAYMKNASGTAPAAAPEPAPA